MSVLRAILAAFPLAGGCCGFPRTASETEVIGPFEVVTHARRSLAGWNEGQLRWAWHGAGFSIRHNGRPFTFASQLPTGTRVFDRVVAVETFPSATPALIVLSADLPGSYYLVREHDGAPVAELLGPTRDRPMVDWIDRPPGVPGRRGANYYHRTKLEAGGRFMLVGDQCVLDAATLTAYPFELHAGVRHFDDPGGLALSPDQASFVRYATGPVPQLVVYDFRRPASYVVPLRRSTMRYRSVDELDAAWLGHHFEWVSVPGGHDRLEERAGVVPLPNRGRIDRRPHSDVVEAYSVAPVASLPATQAVLVTFLQQELGGELLPRREHSTGDEVRVRGQVVHVAGHGDRMALWVDSGQDTAVVMEVAGRFDRVLVSGQHDDLFAW